MIFRKKPKIKRPLARRIINYFIGAGVALIVIILLAVGFSQTSTFRNWFKEFVTEQVNSSTNGTLSIGNIDGTIFTTLILSNTVYTIEKDTLFSAETIELKVSTLRVLLKTIYIRKLEIDNAKVSLLKDENGDLNISKITSPSKEEEKKDTVSTSEPFNWKIEVASLTLTNFNFSHQTISNKNSTAEYPQPEMNDLRLNDINLSLSG
ncbi:MAG: AsmA family protein, partial [Ignavibacteriaceae bacterium]|nr:AsmA family protein [Ignavibacteriaceae bacterium]